jgi:hypothetical protein
MRRCAAIAVALAAATAAAGCSIGSIRREAPAPTTPPPDPQTVIAPTPAAIEQRVVDVAVPGDYSQQTVEFVSRSLGYALFTRCGVASPSAAAGRQTCNAILLATQDGGLSWHRVPHPQPDAVNHQLYASDTRIALLAEPYGWWVSPDLGHTFTHVAAGGDLPAAYRSIFGRYQLCCDGDENPHLVLWNGRLAVTVAPQPPVPGLVGVAESQTQLFVVGLRDGQPSAAVSDDLATSWKKTYVAGAGERFVSLRILTSVGQDGDAWLIGDTDRTTFPMIWHYDGSGWRPAGATGHPPTYVSVAAAGEGVLAVSGAGYGGTVVGDAFRPSAWPISSSGLLQLSDGTLFSQIGEDIYLGIGNGLSRRWVKIVLERM